jgi:hypothetical protein
MIGDLFGPVCGSRHDAYMKWVSMLNPRMAACQAHNPYYLHKKSYEDRAYTALSHAIPAHKAMPGFVLPPHLFAEILMMSKQRIDVEWGWQRVFICACLYSNVFTCLYGYQANTYWNCRAPRLGNYFGIAGLSCDTEDLAFD